MDRSPINCNSVTSSTAKCASQHCSYDSCRILMIGLGESSTPNPKTRLFDCRNQGYGIEFSRFGVGDPYTSDIGVPQVLCRVLGSN